MRNKVVQLSLSNTYTDVLDKMEENKSELVELLEEHIDFEAIIPPQFQYAYHNHYGVSVSIYWKASFVLLYCKGYWE